MNSKRIISFALSLLMIAGLISAFPAIIASAAGTNVALGKKYAYSLAPDSTIVSDDGKYAFSEVTLDAENAYHTGFLTDGTKPQIRAGFYDNPGWLGYINKVENVTFTFDLEDTYDISSVSVFLSWADPPTRLASQPTKLEVAYSADGNTFNTAEDIKDKYDTVPLYQKDLTTEYTKGHNHTTNVSGKGVRYVKLTVSTPWTKNDAGQYVSRLYIGEVTVIGEKAGGTPSTNDTDISKDKQYAYSLAPDTTAYSGEDYAYAEKTRDDAGAYHAGYLTDGNKPIVRPGYYANRGWLGYVNKVENVTFTVNLNGTYNVSSVSMYLCWDAAASRLAVCPTKLEVAYSSDGTNFTTAEDIKDKYDTVTIYDKDETTASTEGHTHTTNVGGTNVKYVRFTVSTPWEKNDRGYISRLFAGEITVMGSPASTAPTLAAPVLSISNVTNNVQNRYGRYATYTIPTISWNAVANATAYDVYFNGEKVLSDTTALSYTPSGIEPQRLYGYGDMRVCESCYVVAKGTGYADSEQSDPMEFILVHKPTDRYGNEVTSADFIIDPGHGGPQSPGACYGDRVENVDTLNLALKFGGYLEAAGYTVAYTRITDIFDNIYTKAGVAHAGNFKAFICNHRNASSPNQANGCEYYAHSASPESKALAQAIEAEIVADGIWKNRGQKTNDAFAILRGNVNIPTTLIEIGFIDSDADNEKYDTYFDETAQAIARGCIKFIQQPTGYTTAIEGTEPTQDLAAAISALIQSGENYSLSGTVSHGFNIDTVQYKLDNGEWKNADLTTVRAPQAKGFSFEIDYALLDAGSHNIDVRGITAWNSTTVYTNTFDIAGVTLTVEQPAPQNYTVTFSADENGSVSFDTLTVLYGTDYATIDLPVATPNDGYHFKEWQIVSGALDSGLIVGDVEVRAIFEADPVTPGDVNEDTDIDACDAMLILRADAGTVTLTAKQARAADVTGDNAVDSSDVSAILKYDAGIISAF